MTEERIKQRRLAAILAADVVGYSRLMEQDEAGTLEALKRRRKDVLEPLVAQHQGRIVKVMGDGVLVEFASVVNAVVCAAALQEKMAVANNGVIEDSRIVLRIGINLGDVLVEGGDLYGDGINIAARLERLAEPGDVLLSQAVFGQVRGKVGYSFEDLGDKSLKHIAEAIRVYRLCPLAPSASRGPNGAAKPSKPSLAILPFTNMSGDPEQEYFSDGITEDIITDLSRVSALFVVARNTAFVFKGKAVDVMEVARRLNVGHILEGSVRKAGNRVRITAQLLDGATGGHIWAERYDRELVDIFAVQDEIAKSIVAVLRVKLLPAEMDSIGDRSTSNADAYEWYLQGKAKFLESWGSKPTVRTARELFAKAVEVDPGYAKAYAGIATCDAFLWVQGDLDISAEGMLANSEKALQMAPDLAEAHAAMGVALYATGHSKDALAAFTRAIELDPVLQGVHFFYGLVARDLGDLDKAAAAFQRGAGLRADDFASLSLLADVYEAQGRHAESQAAARRGLNRVESILSQRPNSPEVLALGAANAVYLAEYARAEEWAQRAVQLEPENFTARYNVACAYAVMGKAEIAMEHLEYMYSKIPKSRQWLAKIMVVDTQLKSMRGRADYQDLEKRLAGSTTSSS
jgi:adenylate cyclase